jgi:hypothetical protein
MRRHACAHRRDLQVAVVFGRLEIQIRALLVPAERQVRRLPRAAIFAREHVPHGDLQRLERFADGAGLLPAGFAERSLVEQSPRTACT